MLTVTATYISLPPTQVASHVERVDALSFTRSQRPTLRRTHPGVGSDSPCLRMVGSAPGTSLLQP